MSDLFFDEDEHRADRRGSRRGRRRGGGHRVVVVLAAALALVGLVFGLFALWVQRRIDPSGGPGTEVAITIPEGATTSDIADLLDGEDVVSDARVFRYYVALQGGGPFQAGEYVLAENSAMGEVVDVLDEGPEQRFDRLTVPEGLTFDEVVGKVGELERFSGDRFRQMAEDGTVRSRYLPAGVDVLEGVLFPDTYQIAETEDEEAVLGRMVQTFDQVASEIGYDRALAATGRSPYEVIIVASLVEAEAKVDADRAKIARVIYNRLEKDIPLGIDATIYYALGRKGGSLTQSDLAVNSPYNTREVMGLPPTPVAIPGRASLEAALNPEPGAWVFYVLADESGVHAFSETSDQFARDKAEAQSKGLIP